MRGGVISGRGGRTGPAWGSAQHRRPRPSAAPQDTRLPPRAPAPSPFLPLQAAPCPAQRSRPHLPAKQQLKRLFWQKHALTVTQLFKENISLFFPGTALDSFLRGLVTTARGHMATRAVTASHPLPRVCGIQVGHPSPSRSRVLGNSVQAAGPASRSHSGAQGPRPPPRGSIQLTHTCVPSLA